jgi:hypothetical protein
MRLMRVTLLDCKPFAYAPVVSDELLVGFKSGKVVDATALLPAQVGQMVDNDG